jgi:aminoglycoside phosphotransferase (APT) family kinase protein
MLHEYLTDFVVGGVIAPMTETLVSNRVIVHHNFWETLGTLHTVPRLVDAGHRS